MPSSNTKPPLYLIDAYGFIYRFYFAFASRPLRNREGRNISVLVAFARTMVSLLDEGAPGADETGALLSTLQKPRRLAVVFDSRTPTFRHKKYPEYKAHRQKTPEDLHEQVPLIEEFLAALGVPCFRADGYEADDIIATLARKCTEENRCCYILSADKDLLQLVGKGIYALQPAKGSAAGTKSSYELLGPTEVKLAWGVNPEQMLDMLSLMGDSSDNVPGVSGIGEKIAAKLMARYGSLDGIYANLAGIEGAVGKKLAQGKDLAYLSQSLIALESGVPLSLERGDRGAFSVDALSVEHLDRAAGARILLREGVRQSAKALDPLVGSPGESKLEPKAPEPVPSAESNRESWPVDPGLLGAGAYQPLLDLDALERLLETARKQGFMALDFETDSLDAWNAHPVGVSLALKPKEAVYVPLASHQGTAPFLPPEQVRDRLALLFADPCMTIIAHNAKYDYEVSRNWGIPRWRCRIWDTMVAAWLMSPERKNYSLDSLGTFCFSYQPLAYKDIVPKDSTFDAVPLETALRYAAEDADLCMRLWRVLEPVLHSHALSLKLFEELEMPLLPILAEMEGEGIQIKKAVLSTYAVELAAELQQIQGETYSLVGHEFNLASPKQLQEVLFTERKLKPGRKTKTGYSTDVEVLEELAREDPVPACILRYRTLAKLKSTYVDTLADMADGADRVHTSFIQTGTVTGRLSSRDPNLQNIPIRDEAGRRIREAFIAGPGKVLISADYSQIELVVLAHLSEDPNLMTAFREGKDVHAQTAALIFGIPEAQVQGDQRRIAKTINFGVMYGMSAFRLANSLGISRSHAAAFIDTYFKTYAGIRTFMDELIHKAEETGYAATILGRRRAIGAINSQNKTEKAGAEREAVNTPIQGSAADIVKTAMVRVDRRLVKEKSPARLLLQVHDELILEVPQSQAKETVQLVQYEMENAITLKVPLRVSVETGLRWGDFH
ncbi:MAG: DNA polymerase I [Spirochaetaceae bacterium]|jgi:DNA polymerase-1|nr:DNA polymerase I [Spirochaetaceae bacterium]